ncbi:MAG: class I SAM-dependent methyltransferase [Desulfurococcaceae archaeon]
MDFHSHIRYRAIKKLLSPSFRNIEIGAGIGLMSFHFVLNFKKPILVLTYTIDEYNKALSIIKEVDWLKSYVILGKGDAQNLKFLPNNYFDQALLIDVLEHVKNDDKVVKEVYRILKPKGRAIVSVPTPYYPHYFTPEFDHEIGHLRHYTLNSIKFLFEMNGFKTIRIIPHTSSLSGALSYIWYGKLKTNFILKAIIMPIIITLSFLTEKLRSQYYCGLSAVFEKL